MNTKKMRTAITSKTAAVARRDLRSETQSWRKWFTKKHPIYGLPHGRRRRRRQRRRKNFLPPPGPRPITRRDNISRSGKPLTPMFWAMLPSGPICQKCNRWHNITYLGKIYMNFYTMTVKNYLISLFRFWDIWLYFAATQTSILYLAKLVHY